MAAPDEPGLLAALVGQRGDLSGVRALLAEGGIVERQAGDLRPGLRRLTAGLDARRHRAQSLAQLIGVRIGA